MLIHCRSKMEEWLKKNAPNGESISVTEENREELQQILDTDSDNMLKLKIDDYIFCPKGEWAEIHSNAWAGHKPGGTEVRARMI